MRTLTKETKQVLSNILLVKGELKTQDHLLAVLAQIALTYNHDLTAKDYADLDAYCIEQDKSAFEIMKNNLRMLLIYNDLEINE